ncbi:endonuclease III [Nodosilinea sp. LEGE 07088]|uniref:endonuclease III n=1 Tax=Nodosilinea sp. LEGE 07088 TaxID=2777968 RepID=UPI001881EFC3|nr:endonuclease III [Nodosilinea sp. LEGE 07088]MBE9140148.1 endonuclease III [Nodosilinea sp. LEGE 07088]
MPNQRRASKKQRALEILIRLKRLYPDAPCSLDFANPLQLMVATMLAAQCTDERVNLVTPALFAAYPDVYAFAEANLEDLEGLVKSTGFYRNKAKNIRAACQKIVTEFNGDVPKRMEDLVSLPGIARKTANVVLAHGFGINAGVTVDTHVKRISNLLGLTQHSDPVKIERDLIKLLPQPDWENWSIRLVYHGRAVCKARNPNCGGCTLADLCPSAKAVPEVEAALKRAGAHHQAVGDGR